MKVCPDGWHLPSNAEWDKLSRSIGDNTCSSALPGGSGTDGSFEFVGYDGWWWSASENYGNFAYSRHIGTDGSVYHSYAPKSTLFSVRCVQD